MRRFFLKEPEQLNDLQGARDCPLIGPDELQAHRPDRHLLVADDNGVIVARCSLWQRPEVRLDRHTPGFVGHYRAVNEDAALLLLEGACEDLRSNGCTLAIGPIDGTTWRRYRCIVERGVEPPFFLEPDTPDAWPSHFRRAGFFQLASYISSLNSNLACHDPRHEEIAARMEALGVGIRPIDLGAFRTELEAIHDLSCTSFSGNFLYSPINRDEFLAMYEKLKPLIRPELTCVAVHEGRTVGFLFAVPDFYRQQRGEPMDRVVAKTIATLPSRNYRGLGRLMFNLVLRSAHQHGFRQAVHALMHESNRSAQMGLGDVKIIRRYALFGRELA